MESSPLLIIFWVAVISVAVGLFIKSRRSKHAPENLPQLFLFWKKQSILHKLKVISCWAFFLYTLSPIYLPVIDVMMDFELGYIDHLEDMFNVYYDDVYDVYPVISAIETYFLNVGVSAALMALLTEASLKDLSAWIKKTPIAINLIRRSGDSLMLNPSISFAYACKMSNDVKRLHTVKMILNPIFSFLTAMCISGFIDNLLTYTVMQSLGHVSYDEVLGSVFATPAVIIGIVCLIAPTVITIALSKKVAARLIFIRTHLSAPAEEHTDPTPTPTPAPAAAPSPRPHFNDDGDISTAFGGSKNGR